MTAQLEAPQQQLRAAGLRVTQPRLAVLRAVHAHPHADTRTITSAARAELPAVSQQTVYDCLDSLTNSGLVRRIQPSGSLARYETRTGDNHHHVVCHECGDIHDVDCATGEAPCMHPAADHGYAIRETEVIYWGLCPSCAAKASNTSPRRLT